MRGETEVREKKKEKEDSHQEEYRKAEREEGKQAHTERKVWGKKSVIKRERMEKRRHSHNHDNILVWQEINGQILD